MKRYYELFRYDPVWSKIISYSLVVFFMRLADAMVSFWAPELIQTSLNNSFLMGIIISFQSVVGLVADIVFPVLFKKGSVKKFTVFAIILSAATVIFLYISSLRPMMIFFLISMAMWGIYYELEAFGIFQFVDKTAPLETRSAAWGIMGIFASLAYLLGPLIAIWLLIRGNIYMPILVLILLGVAFFLFTFHNKAHNVPLEPDIDGIKPWQELDYWFTLFKRIWPVILITLLTSAVDAIFWTTGVIWTAKLIKINPFGSLFLSVYQFPTLFMGLIIARLGIYKGKKRLALKFLVIAGFFLAALSLSNSIYWILLMTLLSSIALSVSFPLIAGVYSDIIARLGTGEKKHLIGLTSSITNVSYILLPPIAGLIAGIKGEKMTFVYIGILLFAVSLFLFFIIPKKLRLNQEEISKWEK